MLSTLKLIAVPLFVVLMSGFLYWMNRKIFFRKLSYWQRQIIIGLVYGGLAIFGTEFGMDIGGAVLNVRDSAPLCAGLIFGAPAGIIAGLIGGIERWFAVYWGAGVYTRMACSLATIIAGFFAAWIRKFIFDNKIPSWYYGLSFGFEMEVMHMLLIFLTNMNDIQRAFYFVQRCTVPMVLLNGIAVMLSVMVVTSLGKGKEQKNSGERGISQTFQRGLLFCIVIGFSLTCLFVAFLQNSLSISDSTSLLRLNLVDVRNWIQEASDTNLLRTTRKVAGELSAPFAMTTQRLMSLAEKYDVAEIDVIDAQGIITASTNEDYVGFDMSAGEQSAAFLPLLSEVSEIVQAYQPISYDSSVSMKYAGVSMANGGFIQVAYNGEQVKADIDGQIVEMAHNWHIGETGGILIVNENGMITSDDRGNEGKSLTDDPLWVSMKNAVEDERFRTLVYGNEAFCMEEVTEGYYILAWLPEKEALFNRNVSIYITVFMEILLFAALFIVVYYMVKKVVLNNIYQINASLARITNGNLNEVVNVRSSQEFSSLSDDINSTVNTLKKYIAEASTRIDKELAFARSIQLAALPSVFPPFPGRMDFDIYATMDTAKAVGGDFYDLFLINQDQLAVVIADVSGKGIPAALFMMTAKTLIKNFGLAGRSPVEVFELVNNSLCENNEAEMFVTAFMAVLDFQNGKVRWVNAGHNKPLLRSLDGHYHWLDSKPGFVLGGMAEIKFREYSADMHVGDQLFLYTDGVTEAVDTNLDLYSDQRLIDSLNRVEVRSLAPQDLLDFMQRDIQNFSNGAEQADDITMLSVRVNSVRTGGK